MSPSVELCVCGLPDCQKHFRLIEGGESIFQNRYFASKHIVILPLVSPLQNYVC